MDSGSGVVGSQKVREPSFLAKRTWYVFMQIRIIKTRTLSLSGEISKILQQKKITVRVTQKVLRPKRKIKLVKNCYPRRNIRRLAFVT